MAQAAAQGRGRAALQREIRTRTRTDRFRQSAEQSVALLEVGDGVGRVPGLVQLFVAASLTCHARL